MKLHVSMLLALALGGCAVRESFDFTLTVNGVAQRVTSSADATGEVTNAGVVTLGDASFGVVMDLGGLAPGNHALGAGSGELQLLDQGRGETYAVSLGGTCDVWLDPHGTANGVPVSGHFSCAGLGSTTGKTADVTNGTFEVTINDPANNPGK